MRSPKKGYPQGWCRLSSSFVDTNVFLRFLTDDDPEKAGRAEVLFKRAVAGQIHLETTLLVIAEIIWTLESFYRLSRADIAQKVEMILNTPNLSVREADAILEALDLYVTRNVDFVDAYHGVTLRDAGIERVLTYDRKHFERLNWLTIIEP